MYDEDFIESELESLFERLSELLNKQKRIKKSKKSSDNVELEKKGKEKYIKHKKDR